MLVRLADWCYRRRRLVVVLWIAALVGAFALAGAFGGEFRQDYLQPGSESQAASDTLQDQVPAAGRATPSRSWSTPTPASPRPQCGRGPSGSSPTSPRATTSWASSARSPRAAPARSPTDGRTAYADVALDKNDRRVHRRRGQGTGRTDPRGRRRHAAGRGRRPRRGVVPDGARRIGGHRPHRRRHHPAGHLRLRGGDGPAAAHRTVRPRHRDGARGGPAPRGRRPGLGARPPRRWSASASASTTPCSSSPGSAAASPKDRSRDARP